MCSFGKKKIDRRGIGGRGVRKSITDDSVGFSVVRILYTKGSPAYVGDMTVRLHRNIGLRCLSHRSDRAYDSPESNSHRIHVILYLKKHLFANGVVIIPDCIEFFVGGCPG